MRITRPRATKISQITIDADLAMGAHNVTLGVGQTVDGKDVSTLIAALSELPIDADLDMGAHTLKADTIAESTVDAGVEVDGVDVGPLPSIIHSIVKIQSHEVFGAHTAYEITSVLYQGGCFTATHYAFGLKSVGIVLKRDAGTSGDIHCVLKAADGAHKPTGSVLASTTIPKSTLTTDYAWVVFTFPNAYTIAEATEYCLYFYSDTGSAWYRYDGDTAAAPEVGRINSGNSGGTWTVTTTDSFAYIFMGEL